MIPFLIVVLSSIVLGLIPAFIAKKMQKGKFITWWIYGALALPIALLHILLIILKLEKIVIVLRILLIFYILFILYFTIWFISTQPTAMIQAGIVKKKYAIGNAILENMNELTSGQVNDLEEYLSNKSGLSKNQVENMIIGFRESMIKDEEYVRDYALYKMLASIKENVSITNDKAAFYHFSVPLGASSSIYDNYIKSLETINKYYSIDNSDDLPELEYNYQRILDYQYKYFKKSDIADTFISHLDNQKKLAETTERKKELIEYYAFTGDTLKKDKKMETASNCYKSATGLYSEILGSMDTIDEEYMDMLYSIADINNRNNDIQSVIQNIEDFLVIFFENDFYTSETYFTRLKNLYSLDLITKNKENIILVNNKFSQMANKYKPKAKSTILFKENALIEYNFKRLAKKDRQKYIDQIYNNYIAILDTEDISTVEIPKRANLFLSENKYEDIVTKYFEIYISKLEKLNINDNSTDENLKIIDCYEFIGDVSKERDNKESASKCYNNAIDIYKNIIASYTEINEDYIEKLNKIAVLNNKNDNPEAVMKNITDYISIIFENELYDIDITYTLKLRDMFILNTVFLNEKHLSTLVNDNFIPQTDKYRSNVNIAIMENTILEIAFPNLSNKDKEKYYTRIDENYKKLVSADDFQSAKHIRKAYTFFSEYKYKKQINEYTEVLKSMNDNMIAKEDNIRNKELGELFEIQARGKVLGRKIIKGEERITLKDKEELEKIKAEFDMKKDNINNSITDIKRASDIVEEILDIEKTNEELDKLVKEIKDKTLELATIYKNAMAKF